MAIKDLKWYVDHHVMPKVYGDMSQWRARFEGASNFLFGDQSQVLANWDLRRYTRDYILEQFQCFVMSDRGTEFATNYVKHEVNLHSIGSRSVIEINFYFQIDHEMFDVAFYRDRLSELRLIDEEGNKRLWRQMDVRVGEIIDTRATVDLRIDLTLEW